jgi:hypothetical protein
MESEKQTVNDSRIAWRQPVINRCIVTGTDNTQEDILPWWYSNVRAWTDVPVMVADFGMSLAGVNAVRKAGMVVMDDLFALPGWWNKPLAILRAGGGVTLWLDTDVEVCGRLDELFAMPSAETPLWAAPDGYCDTDALYGTERQINSGVLSCMTGGVAVQEWAEAILRMFRSRQWELYGDQSILNRMIESGQLNPGYMERRFNMLRLHRGDGGPGPIVCRHWTGPTGKQLIRGRMREPGAPAMEDVI